MLDLPAVIMYKGTAEEGLDLEKARSIRIFRCINKIFRNFLKTKKQQIFTVLKELELNITPKLA